MIDELGMRTMLFVLGIFSIGLFLSMLLSFLKGVMVAEQANRECLSYG